MIILERAASLRLRLGVCAIFGTSVATTSNCAIAASRVAGNIENTPHSSYSTRLTTLDQVTYLHELSKSDPRRVQAILGATRELESGYGKPRDPDAAVKAAAKGELYIELT